MPEVTWQPSALAPVFHGEREYGPADGAPCPVPVYHPSLDGSPQDAEIFAARGAYPLIVFAHGQCSTETADHFRRWQLLPARLARAGYVVAVPQLAHASDPPENTADLNRLRDTARFMRTRWADRALLAPSPSTGLIGHSFGAMLAGRLTARSPEPPVASEVAAPRSVAHRAGRGTERTPLLVRVPTRPGPQLNLRVGAYVGLSGSWGDGPEMARELAGAHPPKLLVRGDGATEFKTGLGGLFDRFRTPRHSALFAGMEHFDHLLAGAEPTSCARLPGPCRDYTLVMWDLVTMFFGRYLPSPEARDVAARIGPSLLPPPLHLTRDQEFFAGGWLTGFNRLALASADCAVNITYDTAQQSGTLTRRGQRRRG